MAHIFQFSPAQQIYIGSINDASNLGFLEQKQIKYIINQKLLNSFGTNECPNVYEYKPEFKYLKLNIQPNGDINPDQMIEWFQNNREGNVLIHSQLGINRSAALLISIVQRITQADFNTLFQTISFKKPDIKITSKIIEPQDVIQLDQYFQLLSPLLKQQFKTQKNCAFKCGKCRTDVFVSGQLIHGIKPDCKHYFTERPEFIEEFDQDGKIQCQKCTQRVGDFKYIGAKCNCGEYICPAYMYNKAKVDKKVY